MIEEALLVTAGDIPSEAEALVKKRVEQIGFEVIAKSARDVQKSDASGMSVIVISSGSPADQVNTKFTEVAVPVVVLNHELFCKMKMARKPSSGIPDQTAVRIIDRSHPMAAGLADDVKVCEAATLFSGKPHPSAMKIASDADEGSRYVWFAYERGNSLVRKRRKARKRVEGSAEANESERITDSEPVAPARRVGLFFSDEVALRATDEGWSFFSAAVCWAAGREVLLVVGSIDHMTDGDRNIGQALQQCGYAVTVREDTKVLRSDADRKALIVLSSTVNEPRANREFRDATVPAIVLKGDLFAAMGMTGDSNCDYGEIPSQTSVKITRGGHPLCAGLFESVVVCNGEAHLSWGIPKASATTVAVQDSNGNNGDHAHLKTVMFGYKAGAEMFGLDAPARRVGLFLSDSVAADCTDDGRKLFAAAVAWAVDTRDKEVLLVVGLRRAHNGGLAGGDREIQKRLNGLCYSVTLSNWGSVKELDVNGKSLVVISSTVDDESISDHNNYNFADSTSPVLCMSPDVFPQLGMTAKGIGTDYGRENASRIDITDPHHPMAAGLRGTTQLGTEAVSMGWGNPSSTSKISRSAKDVITVAQLGQAGRSAIFGFDAGATMFGRIAPSRRVGFFFSEAVATRATDAAWRLFDSAVNWAAGVGVMSFRDVFIEEWQEVLQRRARFYDKRASRSLCSAPENLVGLALSGGGIRSATFSLGVLQGLHNARLLRIFDYLSTVSGGGYAGGWWSAWLSRYEREQREGIFPRAEEIEPVRCASYIDRDAREKIAEGSLSAGKDPIHHLRLFANYLTPRKGALSGDTWRASAVISRNLIMTWLIMIPIIVGFVFLGQLYFVLQPNSLWSFLDPYYMRYEQVLEQRNDYASDFAEIVPDKNKQDLFEQTAEYLTANTGRDYMETVDLLRREIAHDSSEPFSEEEQNNLKNLSAFLAGNTGTSEKREQLEDLARLIVDISVDGFESIVTQLENEFGYIPKCLPPREEYDKRRAETGNLKLYFETEGKDSSPTSENEPINIDAVKRWLRSLAKPIGDYSLDSETQPKVEQLANVLSAISQNNIIELRRELTTQSLDQEQTKVLDKIMEEATSPLRLKHASDLRERAVQIIVPLLPIGAWIALMFFLWMRTGMPTLSWAYLSHWVGGLSVFVLLVCGVLLFMFPLEDVLISVVYPFKLWWHSSNRLLIGLAIAGWSVVAFFMWLFIRSSSSSPPPETDRRAVRDWNKEVRRNKIERVHSTLLVILVIAGCVLALSGYGHEIVDYVWADPQPKKWLGDYIAKAGGWLAVITAIAGSIYTAVKAGPSGGADNRQSGKDSPVSGFVFALTPTLVVVVLTVLAAWLAHWLLWHAISESIPFFNANPLQPRFPPLTVATVVGVLLCLYFAVFEMKVRKGWVAAALFFAVCVIELFAGAVYLWKLNLTVSRTTLLVLVGVVLAVGCLILFRLMVVEADGFSRLNAPKLTERFEPRVLRDILKKAKKPLRWLAVFCALPLALILLSDKVLPFDEQTGKKLSVLTVCWLVGITMCLSFFIFEIVLGKSDNQTSIWLATLMYAALCALFVFSFYRSYGEHKSIMLGHAALGLLAMTFTWVVALGWMADPNRLSLHTFYRARLVRAYMGASNPVRRNRMSEITESVAGDDVLLQELRNCRNGAPYHVVNTTLSLVGGRDLTTAQRSAAVFAMTKRYCGSTRTGYRKSEDYMNGRLTLGTAVAVSGAAVSPTMGAKNPTASLAMLMTLLNIRLGYWAPTPNKEAWKAEQARLWPFYMLHEFLSQTNDVATYCYLTDGGHFDNTGLYSLIERACRYVVVVDNGQDPAPCFQDLGETIRRCRIDFGAEIELDVAPLFKSKTADENREYARQHFVVGTIVYSSDHLRRLKWSGDIANKNRRTGTIILIKPSLAGDETVDVKQYGLENASFPQQKTSDQWFDEAQFESYRRLGQFSVERVFGKDGPCSDEDKLTLFNVEQTFDGARKKFQDWLASEKSEAEKKHHVIADSGK